MQSREKAKGTDKKNNSKDTDKKKIAYRRSMYNKRNRTLKKKKTSLSDGTSLQNLFRSE